MGVIIKILKYSKIEIILFYKLFYLNYYLIFKMFTMKNHVKSLAKLMLVMAIGFMMTVNGAKGTPSTIVWIPSVDFQGFNSWHLGIDNYIRAQDDNGVRGAGIYDAGITVGILPFKKFQAEIGIDYLSMGDRVYDTHPVYFNGKVGCRKGPCLRVPLQ